MRHTKMSASRGMVLVWALVLSGVMTLIVGALGSYYVSTARVSNFYMAGTEARFAEQRALESITSEVGEAVNAFSGGTSMVGDFTSIKSIKEIVDVLDARNNKTITTADGYELLIGIDGQSELEEKLKRNGVGEVKITAEIVKSPHGGIEAGSRVQQTLKFEAEAESAATTIPLFDFVYFANNNGRLNSQCIVANGDVGANGKFELKGATLNGFAKAGGKITLHTGNDNPKIWPRPTYMAFVAAQYGSYFTQTRPTDPIEGGEGATAYSIDWPGGYDPARTSNPYSADYDDPPSEVKNPGTAPSWNKAVPTPPNESDYAPDLQEYPSRDPKWTLPEKGKGDYAYTSEPKKGKGDYAYPDEPYRFVVWFYNGKSYGSGNSGKKKAYAAYDADVASQDKKYETAHANWVADCTAKDNAWQQKCNEINADYQNECDKIDAANEQATAAAKLNYENACAQYKKDAADYAKYQEDLKTWTEENTKYQKYLSDLDDYNQRLSKYLSERAAWDTRYAEGKQIDNLTWETVGESSSTNTILKEGSALIEWPEELATAANCKKYCTEYALDETNALGEVTSASGTLTCKNVWNNKQITFTIAGTNHTEYIQASGNLVGSVGDVLATETGDIVSLKRTLKPVNASGGCVSSDFVPITDVGKNVSSGDLSAIHANELGSIVLIGTQEAPIFLNGPVFVPGDVVIRGLVSGRGTIYAGRNIHIIGDISYQNPPNWPHECDDLTKYEEYSPSNVKIANSTKDLLSLVAMGNIIVGDYTSGIWTNETQMGYLNLSGQENLNMSSSVAEDTGVGSRNHDYSAEDGGTVYDFAYTHTDSGRKKDYVPGRLVRWYHNVHTYTFGAKSCKRHFYESKLGGDTISGLKQTTAQGTASSWSTSTRFIKQLINDIVRSISYLFGIRKENVDASGYNPATVPNLDPGDIIEIDAVLFANHGIFGVVGGDSERSFTLNGAMLCRDEGLLTSFDDRYGNDGNAKAWLNWDMRVKSGSAEGIRMGLIETQQNSKQVLKMHVSDWQQLSGL